MYSPQVAVVEVDDSGTPRRVEGVAVDTIREDWLVEDRWWTERPLRRHYYELALVDGGVAVVFCDLLTARWLRQAA